MAEPKTLTPAYVPFKTFVSVLDSFKGFLPDIIDSTMWPSYSGGIKSQLMGALRFLLLIDDGNHPTQALRKLAESGEQERPALFRSVMKDAYTSLMTLDLTRATPGSFDAEMRKFGQEGETHRKAVSFFLQAAKWSGVPLAPLLLQKGGLSGTRRKRIPLTSNGKAKPKTTVNPAVTGASDPEFMNTNGGSKREISLSGGAKLYLTTNLDLFRMASEDRKFVMDLLDKMEEYESTHEVETQEENSED